MGLRPDGQHADAVRGREVDRPRLKTTPAAMMLNTTQSRRFFGLAVRVGRRFALALYGPVGFLPTSRPRFGEVRLDTAVNDGVLEVQQSRGNLDRNPSGRWDVAPPVVPRRWLRRSMLYPPSHEGRRRARRTLSNDLMTKVARRRVRVHRSHWITTRGRQSSAPRTTDW